MYWNYCSFTLHPFSAETFEIRGSNTIISHYHYMVYPILGKVVCAIHQIPDAFPDCVAQLDKNWFPNYAPLSQQRYDNVKNYYYKNFDIATIGSLWNS